MKINIAAFLATAAAAEDAASHLRPSRRMEYYGYGCFDGCYGPEMKENTYPCDYLGDGAYASVCYEPSKFITCGAGGTCAVRECDHPLVWSGIVNACTFPPPGTTTPPSNNCNDYDQYSNDYDKYSEYPFPKYVGGDLVYNCKPYGDCAVYECKTSGWCSQAPFYYEPGKGLAWEQAWTELGQCRFCHQYHDEENQHLCTSDNGCKICGIPGMYTLCVEDNGDPCCEDIHPSNCPIGTDPNKDCFKCGGNPGVCMSGDCCEGLGENACNQLHNCVWRPDCAVISGFNQCLAPNMLCKNVDCYAIPNKETCDLYNECYWYENMCGGDYRLL